MGIRQIIDATAEFIFSAAALVLIIFLLPMAILKRNTVIIRRGP